MVLRFPRLTLILSILTLLSCNAVLAHPFPHTFCLPDIWVHTITPNKSGQPVYGSVYRIEARDGFEGIYDYFNQWTNPKEVNFCFAYRTRPAGGTWSNWSARVWETEHESDSTSAFDQWGRANVVTGNWPAGTQVSSARRPSVCLASTATGSRDRY